MLRVFVDSSVLFTMADSDTGASHELLQSAINKKVQLVASAYVFVETERSLAAKKKGHKTGKLKIIQALGIWEMCEVDPQEVIIAYSVTPDYKDFPIVAAARKANVDFLATFDRKHLHLETVRAFINAQVVTPDVVLQEIRR